MPPGVDFRDVLRRRLQDCDVVFSLVGPQWLDLLKARDSGGDDHLRFEIEMAIDSKVRIVPVLLSGAKMPTEAQLPKSIAAFAYLNARSLDAGPDFDDQLRRLTHDLDDRDQTRVVRRTAIAVVGLAALGGTAALVGPRLFRAPTVKSVTILVVMGENVEYEQVMARAFIRQLRKSLSARGIELIERQTLIPRFKDTYASPDSDAGREVWKDVVDNIRFSYSAGAIDYFVTLGSFATLAVKNSDLLHYLNPKGLIYLGVTDPKRSGFIGQSKIAGVQYGTGGIAYGKKIAELFPIDQKLAFIYQSGEDNIQDRAIAADLDELNKEFATANPAARQPRFEIRPMDKLIEISDLALADYSRPRDSEVYFA